MNWLFRRTCALVTGALVAALCADPAAAAITHDGVAGVELGMSEADVRAELGRPASMSGGDQDTKLLDYPRRKVDVLLRDDRVVRIRTTSRSQTTPSGVGPGVTEAAMRRKLRGERCSRARGALVCSVRGESTVLTFVSRRGTVVVAELARAGA